MSNSNEKNKQSAAEFLKLVTAGKIDEAYERFIDMKGRHHNLHFAAGFPVLRAAMKDSHQQFPDKQFVIKRVLGDGDLVCAQSFIALKPGDKGFAVTHTFRFNDGKIVEMWDMMQPIPEHSPNADGVF